MALERTDSPLLKKPGFFGYLKLNSASYILIAPFMILFIMFTVIPVLAAMFLSFTSFNMLQAPTFIGLDNYARLLLEDDIFFRVFQNTIVFAVFTGPHGYLFSFIFAWLINDMKRIPRAICTFVFYAPALTGISFLIWQLLFSGNQYGYLNSILLNNGFVTEPVRWLADENMMMISIIIIQLWMSLGVGFLAFIAGFQGMDRSLFEAGAIDGVKNRFQELRYITIPSMAPQLMFGAIVQISATFAAGDVIRILMGVPTTNYAADVLVTYMSDLALIRFEMGYASTIATVLFLLMLMLNNLIQSVLRKYSTE